MSTLTQVSVSTNIFLVSHFYRTMKARKIKITKLTVTFITGIAIIYLASTWIKREDGRSVISGNKDFEESRNKFGSIIERRYIDQGSGVVTTQKKKVMTKCGDTEDDFMMSSLDLVKPLLSSIQENHNAARNRTFLCRNAIKPLSENDLTQDEDNRKEKCIKSFKSDYSKSNEQFWKGDIQYVRHKHHKYLNTESVVLDIGGNKGKDAEALLKSYNHGSYVILEPIKTLFNALVNMFEKNKNVILYDFGLGRKTDKFFVNVVGYGGDATSIFIENNQKESCLLRVFNTTEFMIRLGVPCVEVDLITINCEGCEFDILETLLSTNIINMFRHIQFATHPTLKHLNQPVARYCQIQEKLSRTHVISYMEKKGSHIKDS